jgi:hypothetical protein
MGKKTNQSVRKITNCIGLLPDKNPNGRQKHLIVISMGYEDKVCLDKEVIFV